MDRVSVLFVCLGNICRSPMAEGLFAHLAARRGLADRFHVESAGTGDYHVGKPPHPRTLQVLRQHGITLDSVARQVSVDDFQRFDVLLAMDESNLRNLRRLAPDAPRARLHRVLEPVGGGDVPDPYFGNIDGYVRNYALLQPALEAWLDELAG